METKQSRNLTLPVAQIINWGISFAFFSLTCLLGYKIGLELNGQLHGALLTAFISLMTGLILSVIMAYPLKSLTKGIKSFLKFYLYTLLFFAVSWVLGHFYPLAGSLNFLNFLKVNSQHTFSFSFTLVGCLIGLF